MKGQDAFGVDHYRPRSLFPALAADYSNLFYACNCCNRRKGRYWPTPDAMRAGEFIPNPCDHVMFDHLRYQSARVITRTPAARRAEKILMLNDDESVKYRELMLDLIGLIEEKIRKLQETIAKIDHKVETLPDQRAVLMAEKQAVESQLVRLEDHLLSIGAR